MILVCVAPKQQTRQFLVRRSIATHWYDITAPISSLETNSASWFANSIEGICRVLAILPLQRSQSSKSMLMSKCWRISHVLASMCYLTWLYCGRWWACVVEVCNLHKNQWLVGARMSIWWWVENISLMLNCMMIQNGHSFALHGMSGRICNFPLATIYYMSTQIITCPCLLSGKQHAAFQKYQISNMLTNNACTDSVYKVVNIQDSSRRQISRYLNISETFRKQIHLRQKNRLAYADHLQLFSHRIYLLHVCMVERKM